MLHQRLILGPILIAVMLVAAWLDAWLDGRVVADGVRALPPGLMVFPIVALLSVFGARELAAILRSKGVRASARVNTALAMLGLCGTAFIPESWSGTSTVGLVNVMTGAVLVGTLFFSARQERVEGAIASAGGALLAFGYLGALMGFLILIRREHEVWVLLWVLLVTKSCDIGAYFTGRSIGRRKLIEWLSPGKTWEGLVGGVITSGCVGAVGAWALDASGGGSVGGPLAGAIAGVVFGLVGQTGDLLASLLKRDAGIKDAGRSLPGFGGILDVVDSPALVAPVAFWWLRLVGSGVLPAWFAGG